MVHLQPERQIDFNGHLWVREEGNVLIDPVPMTAADLEQFDQLGGAAWIVLTNRDHEREAAFFQDRTGARIAAHRADADLFDQPPDRRLDDGEEIVPGLQVVHLAHGKSPGEIALYWPNLKLVLAGDLVVGAPLGRITLLPDAKLADPPQAALGLRKLLQLDFDALLMGDGHSVLHDARRLLLECLEERTDIYINKINVEDIPWTPWGEPRAIAGRPRILTRSSAGDTWATASSACPLASRRSHSTFTTLKRKCSTFLEGSCTLIGPRGPVAVEQGDFIAFPPGPRSAHKFTNQSPQPCVLLALSNVLPHDLVQYPDSDKVFPRALGRQGIFRRAAAVDYWSGEAD